MNYLVDNVTSGLVGGLMDDLRFPIGFLIAFLILVALAKMYSVTRHVVSAIKEYIFSPSEREDSIFSLSDKFVKKKKK